MLELHDLGYVLSPTPLPCSANQPCMTRVSFVILGDDFDDRYCKDYIEIDESKYDKSPESASDLSKRPLGFMSVVIPFVTNNADARNPCFKISLDNKTMQTVQVLVRAQLTVLLFLSGGNETICKALAA